MPEVPDYELVSDLQIALEDRESQKAFLVLDSALSQGKANSVLIDRMKIYSDVFQGCEQEFFLRMGMLFLAVNNPARAWTYFNTVLDTVDDSGKEYYLRVANALMPYLKAQIQEQGTPYFAELWIMRGKALVRADRKEGVEFLQDALALMPDNPKVYQALAEAHLHFDEQRQAEYVLFVAKSLKLD